MAVKYNESIGNQQINGWRGLNFRDSATDSELIDCQNLSSRRYPFFTTRPGRQRLEQYKTPTSVFAWDKLCVVDGGTLYYDNEPVSNTSDNPQFAVVNSKLCIFPDKKYIDLTNGEYRNLEEKLVPVNAPVFTANSISIENNPPVSEHVLDYANGYVNTYGRDPALLSWNPDTGWSKPAATRLYGYYNEDAAEYKGLIIIPAYRNGAFEMVWDRDNTAENNEGYYGVLTSHQIDEYYNRWYFDVYKVGEERPRLSQLFKVGDRVTIEGCNYPVNNAENAVVTGIDDAANTLTFKDDLFVLPYRYYIVTQDLQPGYYNFQYETVSEEDGRKSHANKFETTEYLRKGWVLWLYENKAANIAIWNGKDVKTLPIKSTNDHGYTVLTPTNYASGNTATESMSVTITRKVPNLDYICENGNRLWGVCNAVENKVWDESEQAWKTNIVRTIYASALGDPTNFFVYDGVATDSYALTVASKGDFTDCVSYSDQVLCFKEDVLHRIAGDYPANYAMYTDNIEGVQRGSHRASTIINDVLYYKSRDGVYAYSGGQPRLVSYNIDGKLYSGAAGGTDGIRYYISMTDEDGVDYIFEFDTIHDAWYMQDHRKALGFAYADNSVYFVDGANAFRMQGGERSDVVWSATLTEFDEGSFNHKQYRWLRMEYELEEDSEINVDVVIDGGKTKRVYTSDKPGRKAVNIPLEGMRCNRLKMVISGTGGCTIRRVRRDYIVCSVEE